MREIVANLVPKGRKHVDILDVGSGPITNMGFYLPNVRVCITAVDPLANEYNRILKKHRVKPPVSTQYGEVEKLSSQFGENAFDIVFMQNALDHSYDPVQGIKEMLKVVKPHGHVILNHAVNEAENANYGAFHQWNLCQKGSSFVIWNKQEKHNISLMLLLKAKVTTSTNKGWVKVVIQKLPLTQLIFRAFLK